MANEKRLIEVDVLKEAIWNTDCDVYEFCKGLVTEMGISRLKLDDVIDKVPTVEAVEVVRCKDCKHCFHDPKILSGLVDGVYVCGIWGRGLPHMKPDDFCSYGERKENGRTRCKNHSNSG